MHAELEGYQRISSQCVIKVHSEKIKAQKSITEKLNKYPISLKELGEFPCKILSSLGELLENL